MLNPAVTSGGAQDDDDDRTSTLSLPADPDNAYQPRVLGRLARYEQCLEQARQAMAASKHPNGERDFTTPEAAAVDRVFVGGAILRRRDPEVRRLRRLETRSRQWTDDVEDGAA
jgi:hypothetical protein